MKSFRLLSGSLLVVAFVLTAVRGVASPAPPFTFIPAGSVWRYSATGMDLGTAWREAEFDDSAWQSGPAQLGFGDGDEVTVIQSGAVTAYFRRTFDSPVSGGPLTLRLLRDDGAVVYINGIEVFRNNMPAGPISYNTFATTAVGGAEESTQFITAQINSSALVQGANIVAVEVHQVNITSSDLSFDLELSTGSDLTSPIVTVQALDPEAAEIPPWIDAPENPGIFRIWREGPTNTALQVFYVLSGTASNGVDYQTLSGSAEIVAGARAVDVFVEVIYDAIAETNETVILRVVDPPCAGIFPPPPDCYRIGTPDSAIVSIRDTFVPPPELPVVNVVAIDPDAAESGVLAAIFPGAFRFSRSGSTTDVLTVFFTLSGSAENGVDYRFVSNSVRFNPGQTQTRVDIIPLNDALIEGIETVVLTLQEPLCAAIVPPPPGCYRVGFSNQANVFIRDASGTNIPPAELPMVTVNQPTNGAVFFAPTSVVFRAQAVHHPASTVRWLDLYVGTNLVGATVMGGINLTQHLIINLYSLQAGEHVLTARAYDNLGNRGTSAPVTIIIVVPANTPPVVRIVSPTNGAVLTATSALPIRAEAVFDPSATMKSLKWYRDFHMCTYMDYGTNSFLAVSCIDYIAFPGSSYSYTVVASDNFGNVITSPPVRVTIVSNVPPNQHPQVELTYPDNGDVFTAPTNITLQAFARDHEDGENLTVEFFANGNSIGFGRYVPAICPGIPCPNYLFAWTDPAPGSYMLTARVTDSFGARSNSAPVNITVQSGQPGTNVTLIAGGSLWKYLDNGTDQGTPWRDLGFDDSTWASGPAQLGYGDGDESTVVSFGPDPMNKYITTYFRRSFNVVNAASFSDLRGRLLVDDGAVVYLNGVEIFRNNLPPGPVTHTTLASVGVENMLVSFTASASLLLNGLNVVAAEIHQNAAPSSDLSFDLELIGTGDSQPPPPPELPVVNVVATDPDAAESGDLAAIFPGTFTFSRTGPLSNALTAFFTLSGSAENGVDYRFVSNSVRFNPGQAQARVDIVPLNDDLVEGTENVVLTLPEPACIAIVPPPPGCYRVGPSDRAEVSIHDANQPPDPGTNVTLVANGAVWKYLDNGTDQGTAWRQAGFDDLTWASGPAQLGYGDGDESTVVSFGPDPSNKHITTYFRRAFNVVNAASFSELRGRLLQDDGGAVYLNGVEIFRSNLAPGPISFNTLATATVGDNQIVDFVAPGSLLQEGLNVLAVEMHQVNASSTDLSFDLQLIGIGAPQPPNQQPYVQINSPHNGEVFTAPVDIRLSAYAQDREDGFTLTVEFFEGTRSLGFGTFMPTRCASPLCPSYDLTWSDVAPGNYTLTARAMDSQGAVSNSAPVHISVRPRTPPGTKLWDFASGSVYAPPAVGQDGTVYVMGGNPNPRLYALKPDGSSKWAVQLGHHIEGSPAIGADGTIYVGTDKTLRAYSPAGALIWSFSFPNTDLYYPVSAPAIAHNGNIYVGTGAPDKGLYAINPNGTLKWRFVAGADVFAPVIGTQGTIYFGAYHDRFYALNPDGTKRWDTPMSGNRTAAAVGGDGTIYVVGSIGPNKLFAFDPNGTKKWEAQIGSALSSESSAPVIAADGTIYVGCGHDMTMYAFHPDGSAKWTFASGSNVGGASASPAVDAEGNVYTGFGAQLFAISAAGAKVWSYQTAGGFTAPALTPGGVLYVGNAADTVYAFQGNAGLAKSPWPMFQRDLRHTGAAPLISPPNQAPRVAITRPVEGDVFEPGTIRIEAVTTDPDGYASTVEFLANGQKIGEASIVFVQPPPPGQPIHFEFNWSNAPIGQHRLTARTVDNGGAQAVSEPVNISVVSRPPPGPQPAPGDQEAPAVAANNEFYLVAWADKRGNDTEWDIYAARITPEGERLDPNGIPICVMRGPQQFPAVASDGRDFLVVWHDARDQYGPTYHDIFGARVTAEGVVLDPNGFPISRAPIDQFGPSLAFNGTHYLVAWYDYRNSDNERMRNDIYGARVGRDGVVLDPNGIAICTADNMQWAPGVASLNGDWFVAWDDSRGQVRGSRVTGAGTVSNPDGLVLSQNFSGSAIRVAANASGYLSAWNDSRNYETTQYDIFARHATAAGQVVGGSEFLLCNAAGMQTSPALAAGNDQFLAVWIDDRAGWTERKIFAARIGTDGVLDPNGFQIGAGPASEGWNAVSVGALNGQYLAAWARGNNSDFGQKDIVAVRVTADGAVLDSIPFLVSTVGSQVVDSDNDGVPDDRDRCLGTTVGAVVNPNGCSLAQLCPCDAPWRSHGEYVNCVIQHSWEFFRAGLITAAQRREAIHDAVQSNCGRRPDRIEPICVHLYPLTREECSRNGVQFVLSGDATGSCVLECSEDLVNWRTVEPVAISGWEVTCPMDAGTKARFYRVRHD